MDEESRDGRSTQYRCLGLAGGAAGPGEPGSAADDGEQVVQALMGAEADAVCGAPFGERSEERVNTATGTGGGAGTPGRGVSSWRSRGCARAATSRTGC